MKKSSVSPLKRSLSFPILLLVIILFLIYTIIDTAIVYKSMPLLAVILCCSACIFAIVCIFRFSFTKYEYSFVGEELVIRQYTLRNVKPIGIYPLSSIKHIGRISFPPAKSSRGKKYNLTNSLYATFFSGLIMSYIDFDSGSTLKVLIDPPSNIKRLLKLNLEKKYHIKDKK